MRYYWYWYYIGHYFILSNRFHIVLNICLKWMNMAQKCGQDWVLGFRWHQTCERVLAFGYVRKSQAWTIMNHHSTWYPNLDTWTCTLANWHGPMALGLRTFKKIIADIVFISDEPCGSCQCNFSLAISSMFCLITWMGHDGVSDFDPLIQPCITCKGEAQCSAARDSFVMPCTVEVPKKFEPRLGSSKLDIFFATKRDIFT